MGFTDELKKSIKEAMKDVNQKIVLDLAAGYKDIKGKEITISRGNSPRSLKFKTSGLLGTTVEYEVTGIDWQESAKRSAGKAAAGAIIGGVLTGGIGLVAGAAIGGKRKDTSTAVITVLDNGAECSVYVRCNGKQYEELTGLL